MNLEDLRRKLDGVDAKIVGLIGERVRTAEAIGKEKKRQKKQIEDREREAIVLENVISIARKENISQGDIEGIYRQIIATSKRIQAIEVAFQGEIGAYGEEAAFQFFGTSIQTKACENFEDVFKVVERGEVQFGVVPAENSLEGSIGRVYDLLLDSSLRVCGETELRIVHCLIANPGARQDLIKRVYSHPQALGQCRAFLKHLDCELIPTNNTAGSVKMIKEMGIVDGGAIASARTLYEALKEFAKGNINLTKIESRPTRLKPWEYNFYLDFEGHREDRVSREALEGLDRNSRFMKVMGSYPKAK